MRTATASTALATTSPRRAYDRRRHRAHRRRSRGPPARYPGCGRTGQRRPDPDAAGEDPGSPSSRSAAGPRSPAPYLYSNAQARALLADAAAGTRARTAQDLADCDAGQEAAWRERALNAEDALKAAHAEILQQRKRIGELLGQVRDLEAEWTQEAVQRITTENTTLKQRVRQLTADNRTLDERLKAARSNLRFQDRRIADLEAQLLDPPKN